MPRGDFVDEGLTQEIPRQREKALEKRINKGNEKGLPNFNFLINQAIRDREGKAVHRQGDAKQKSGSDPFHAKGIMEIGTRVNQPILFSNRRVSAKGNTNRPSGRGRRPNRHALF